MHTHLESMEYYGKEQKNHQTVLSADRILCRLSDIAASAFQAWAGSSRLCASALTLTDYLKSLIRRSGFDVAGVHDKKSLEEKLLQLQNADDTLDVGVMMFDMNNLKMINDTYGHEEGDVFIQTFASYLTRILTEDSFLRGSAVMNLSLCRIMQPGTSWSR